MSSGRAVLFAPFVALILACAGCARREPTRANARREADVPHANAPRGARCDGRYGSLCGPGGEADDARRARLERVAGAIEDATLGALAEQIGLSPATREGWARHLASRSPEEQDALRRLFRKVRASEVEQRVAPLRGSVERELAQVLERARAAVAASDDPGREAALARLDATRLSWIDLGDPSPLHARALRRGCGESLLVDDAWIDKTATAITLCPGFLLVSTEPGEVEGGGAAFRERIAFLLAHEVGHVIAGPSEPNADDERATEVAADRWAAEILAPEIEAIEDPGERERFLRRTLEPICSPAGDRVHPSGRERVEGVVREAVGCGV